LRLFRGTACGNGFVDATAAFGLDTVLPATETVRAVAVGDLNRDGWPDLFVATSVTNYVLTYDSSSSVYVDATASYMDPSTIDATVLDARFVVSGCPIMLRTVHSPIHCRVFRGVQDYNTDGTMDLVTCYEAHATKGGVLQCVVVAGGCQFHGLLAGCCLWRCAASVCRHCRWLPLLQGPLVRAAVLAGVHGSAASVDVHVPECTGDSPGGPGCRRRCRRAVGGL
jgi:hypothetical protein